MDVGDVVDDFELPDETGTPRKLSDLLANGPVVLFFYPAAMTSGCTRESCHFRDLAAEFAEVGAQRVGISRDSVDKQHQFSDKHNFDYPLLSDADGEVARMMGVARKKGPPKRVTFVIDQDRKVVEVVKSEIRMAVHADRALDALRKLPRPTDGTSPGTEGTEGTEGAPVSNDNDEIREVEVVTSAIGDDGTVVVDDLKALVDDEGNVLATDETIAAERPDGTIVVDEVISVAGDDGGLVPIEEDVVVIEGDDS